MSPHMWSTISEAAKGFQEILKEKCPTEMLINFRYKLNRSLENIEFRTEMEKCGALLNWDSVTNLCQPAWTQATIETALAAILKTTDKNNNEDKEGPPESDSALLNNNSKKETLELSTPRPVAILERKYQAEYSEDSSTEETDVPKLLISTGYKIESEKERKMSMKKPPITPRPKVFPRKFNRTSTQRKILLLKTEWHNLIGESLEFIDPLNYIKITEILEQPKFTPEDVRILRPLFPFILQKIKMWSCKILTAENLYGLLPNNEAISEDEDIENDDISQDISEEQANSEKTQIISRLDIFAMLVASAEITVLTDIFQNISKFPIALPIILPNPITNENGKSYLVTPALEKCLVKWEQTGKRNGENYLFKNPFKLITAIRIGNHEFVGKSSFLNQLFVHSNVFQCRGQPGKGKPVSLNGSVEFIWLTKDMCKESIWTAIQTEMQDGAENEIVLLANLHGDALEHEDVLQTMKAITSKYIAFIMPNEVGNTNKDKLTNICGKENLLFIYVDPVAAANTSKTLKSHLIVDSNETLNKLKQYIKTALKSGQTITDQGRSAKSECIPKIPGISAKESIEFLDLVHRLSAQNCVRSLLCLQKIKKENFDRYWSAYKTSPDLQLLVSQFVKTLQAPLPERRIALTHIEQELSIFSQKKLVGSSARLVGLLQKRNSFVDMSPQLQEINKEISKIYDELASSLSLNDFLRELSLVFEIIMIHGIPEEISMYSKLPAMYAELLIEGRTLEILDGDTGSVPGIWLESVCHSVCQKLSNLKVFVVSILGLQSSGKSTLLNALFGCKFATSVGKCTKGLYMRLILLEESFQKQLGLDAILVVDTEGLGSPESMMDPNADSKDRTMATFAMTISNLTLINVAGESNKEMVHILQIVILTMARMERTDLSPDILLVQQVPEGGHETLLAKGVDNFCNALEEAVKVIQSKEIDLGVRTLRNLKTLKQRLRQREILYQLRPFKSGASPHAPPTEEYCQDVIGLRNRIITGYTSQKNNFIYFCTWHKLLKSYWHAVQKENFALRFTSITQVQEFIEVNTRVASVKNDLDLAFLYHQRCLNESINEKLNLFDEKTLSKEFETEIHEHINSQIDLLPGNCKSPLQITQEAVSCKWCVQAESSKKELLEYVKQTSAVSVNDTEENLTAYIEEIRKLSKARMISRFASLNIQLGKASEFDTILNKIVRETKKNMKIQSVDDVWNELESTVQKIYPITFVKNQVIDDIVHAYKNIPDVVKWKIDLQNMSFSANDPRRTLAVLNVKRKRRIRANNTPDLNLTTNEHNWLCGKFQEIAENIIMTRSEERAGYADVLVGQHKNKVMDTLEKFEERFKTKLKNEFKWEAIFYSLQLFLELVLQLQDAYNREFEPFFILLKQKQEYLQKIGMYLALQSPTQILSFGITIARKLLEASVTVCMSSFDVGKYLNKWAKKPENIRLRYFISLAEDLKCGKEDVVLGHFRNPQTILTEWYMQALELSMQDIVLPLVKEAFVEECAEIGNQVVNTKSVEELITFINWYLNKVGDSLTLEKITEEMQEKLKVEIQKQMSRLVKDYFEEITVENLPVNYENFWKNLGCTSTCPGCAAICWGSKDHTKGISKYKFHFTCHQPKGLAGVINKKTGELEFNSCWQKESHAEGTVEEKQKLPSIDIEGENEQWLNEKHPIKEYNKLMQWFFLKLKGPLTERFDAKPAANLVNDKKRLVFLENELDTILNLIRHKSEL